MKKISFLVIALMFMHFGSIIAQSDHILWYNQPATYFE